MTRAKAPPEEPKLLKGKKTEAIPPIQEHMPRACGFPLRMPRWWGPGLIRAARCAFSARSHMPTVIRVGRRCKGTVAAPMMAPPEVDAIFVHPEVSFGLGLVLASRVQAGEEASSECDRYGGELGRWGCLEQLCKFGFDVGSCVVTTVAVVGSASRRGGEICVL